MRKNILMKNNKLITILIMKITEVYKQIFILLIKNNKLKR